MSINDKKKAVSPDSISMLEDAIFRADIKTGRRIMAEIAAIYGYEALISDVFEPVLTDLGERLNRKEISLAQSYVVSLMVDDALRIYQDSQPLQAENN
jgi:hypothetical protein